MQKKTHKEILEGFKHHDPRGPDLYVVRSIQGLVESNEIVDDSIKNLQKIIEKFNTEASKQTQEMIILTKRIAGLTLLMLIGLLVQIILAAIL